MIILPARSLLPVFFLSSLVSAQSVSAPSMANAPASNIGQMVNTNEDGIRNTILAKENAVLARWYNGDPMGFIDNSWDDVTYFDASLGSRADGIDAFKKVLVPIIGQIHVPSHKLDKPLVRVFGDIAVLTFTDVLSFGENKTARWHATEVYQRKGNDWKLVHSHWTESQAK